MASPVVCENVSREKCLSKRISWVAQLYTTGLCYTDVAQLYTTGLCYADLTLCRAGLMLVALSALFRGQTAN